MGRLIDADAAVEIIETKQKELCPVGRYSRNYLTGSDREKYDEWEDLIDAVNSIPTVYAVPVVRCGECVYWQSGENEAEKWEYCHFHHIDIGPHSFCSYGERRNE